MANAMVYSLSEVDIATLLVLPLLPRRVSTGFRFHPPLLIRDLCVVKPFICAECEHVGLAFNETHTKKHPLVRVAYKVEEFKISTEERLGLLRDS
jgi:hypothetical protein